MDRTTTTRLHGICALLEEIKPLLQENVGRLRHEARQQEPLMRRLLETEINSQTALIPRIQESVEHLQGILRSEPPAPPCLNVPLVVCMQNGETIAESTGIDTFIKAIEMLGIERVKALDIIAVQNRNLPLISDYEDPEHRQKWGSGYYIAMRNTTQQKKKWLDEIANRLGVEMTVIANPKTHS